MTSHPAPPLDQIDCVVVGLGAIGSATCFSLARAGVDVLGLEQFELGHARGASHDHSRIIRRSYHTPGYVELAGAAYAAWERVPSSEPLVIRTGGIDLFPADAAIPMDDYTNSMEAAGVPFDVLDAAEIMRRWPVWQLDDDVIGLFQADTGIAAAERATAALRLSALDHGARLLGDTTVRSIRDDGNGIVLDTDAGEIHAARVVIAADAWTNHLLTGLDWQVPLDVTQEQLTYTRPADPARFAPDAFPVWIWMDEPSWYGFPEFGVQGWVKTAQDCGGKIVTADTRSFDPDPDAEARLLMFLERALPTASTGDTITKTCLYTLTPDRDFVLDAVPGHPDVFVALGAAHGFKFAAVFGEIMRDFVVDAPSPHDLARVPHGPRHAHHRPPRPRLARVAAVSPVSSSRRRASGGTRSTSATSSSAPSRSTGTIRTTGSTGTSRPTRRTGTSRRTRSSRRSRRTRSRASNPLIRSRGTSPPTRVTIGRSDSAPS